MYSTKDGGTPHLITNINKKQGKHKYIQLSVSYARTRASILSLKGKQNRDSGLKHVID